MPRAMSICPTDGCPNPTLSGRCDDCRAAADTKRRATPEQRAYKTAAHRRMRKKVLLRDPICVLCSMAQSTVADHYPLSRRELVDRGLNPNDPHCCRGLCVGCHNKETAKHQPGGFGKGTAWVTH